MRRTTIKYGNSSRPVQSIPKNTLSNGLPEKSCIYTKENAYEECSVNGNNVKIHYIKYVHAENGPALEYENGDFFWYYNGVIHRKDDKGPAVSLNRDLFWYKHGELHREDGPAIVRANGMLEWYKHGKPYNPKEEEVKEEVKE
jgi:hypothetical protein